MPTPVSTIQKAGAFIREVSMIFESAIKVFAPFSINFSPPNFLNIFLEKWRIYIWKFGV